MLEYHHKMKNFFLNVVYIVIILSISIYLIIKFTHSYWSQVGMPIFMCWFMFKVVFNIYNDYKTDLKISNDKLIISTQGEIHDISFNTVMSIQHRGIAHSIIAEGLVLNCGLQGKILVDSSYENYLELWSKIILYSEQANPRLVMHDSVRKRMEKNK